MLLFPAFAAAACAQIVGVDDYKDAIAELCDVCEAVAPECSPKLKESLDGATDDEVRAWLQGYSDHGCATADCELGLAQCFYSAPGLCVAAGQACEVSESCCGFEFNGDHRGGAGCCGGGSQGACCERCSTCAEQIDAYATQTGFDDAAVCRSQASAWSALLACAKDDPKNQLVQCDAACTGMLASEELCKKCLAEKCQAQFQACGSAEGF